MKRALIITLVCALGLALSAATAQALTLTYGSAYYLGISTQSPLVSPAEASYINY